MEKQLSSYAELNEDLNRLYHKLAWYADNEPNNIQLLNQIDKEIDAKKAELREAIV